jgi:hypothetical protein
VKANTGHQIALIRCVMQETGEKMCDLFTHISMESEADEVRWSICKKFIICDSINSSFT